MKDASRFCHRSVEGRSRLRAALALVLVAALSVVPAQTLTPVAPVPPRTASDSLASVKVDSSVVKKPVARADTARVVMHNFNHRQQLITGGAIMATLVSIMVVMNNYNPRVPQ